MTRPWTVHTGDCRVALAAMEADSVDACVTDTPYGLSTLLDPPNLDREALWQKLTAGQRELPIKTLMRAWLDTGENPVMKGRGFMGKEWDALVPPPNTWAALWRVLKPGAALLAFGGTRTVDLISLSIRFAGFEVEDTIVWLYGQGMPKRVRLDLKIDEHFGKKDERPALNKHPNPAKNNALNVVRFNASSGEVMQYGAATPEAARFVGFDRALRPAYEPVILARKPGRGTIAQTALAHGTGGLHVDACRIPRGDAGEVITTRGDHSAGRKYGAGLGDGGGASVSIHSKGGYPANVILDECAAEALDTQSGQMRDGVAVKHNTPVGKRTGRHFVFGNTGITQTFGGGGGASRFFYTAKASTSERDKGLESLPALEMGHKTGRTEYGVGEAAYSGDRGGGKNPHPTVKPIALMRYLVRLASPPGAHDPDPAKRPVVLDIFAGSGSTLVAGLVEGVRVVGCELDPQSAHVARLRCQHAYALPREADEEQDLPVGRQGALF